MNFFLKVFPVKTDQRQNRMETGSRTDFSSAGRARIACCLVTTTM